MATNSVTITEEASVTTANYPVQIGRPFEQGEIADYPQALVDGGPVTTQADVKQRWGDGSVKHAILTFHVPSLVADSTVTVTFQNQASGNNTGFLDATGMTSGDYSDLDAIISLTSGGEETASLRTMIGAGDFTYWLQGSVTTSIIAADHTATAAYDIGFDAYTPFRPIFHATFFPLTGQVRVRFIGEIVNSEKIEDMTYDLALKTGFASPATVYSKSSFLHIGGSRWTREFWIGGTPPTISIDANLAYLTEARAVPHYDTSKTVPEATIAANYADWLSEATDLGEPGNWTKNMPQTGGRPDIGPLPAWVAKWVYSGDWRLRAQAFGNADLAARWPRHFREGDPTRWFDLGQTVPGIGHVVSIRDRPAFTLLFLESPPDGMNLVGSATRDGWTFEISHMPEPFAPLYLLSGDYWYLEEMWFWSAAAAAYPDGGAVTHGYGRGPTGAEGVIYLSTRAEAWVLRSRLWAAYWSPDGTPEQDYFTGLLDDAAADMEGKHGITGTARDGNAVWQWAYDLKYLPNGAGGKGYGGSPLHIWQQDSSYSTATASAGFVPWMYHYLIYATAQAVQLGYDFDDLLTWQAEYLTGYVIGDGGGEMNPYLVTSYGAPSIETATGTWFQTWAEQLTGYPAGSGQDQQETTGMHGRFDYTGGYAYIARTAMAGVYAEANGPAAWDWIDGVLGADPGYDDNPQWAIVPMAVAALPSIAKGLRYTVRTMPGALSKTAGYAVRTTPGAQLAAADYVVDAGTPAGTAILDEWFDGTLAAWTVSGADIVTADNDEKLRLNASGESAYRDFTAPATGPLMVESDLGYSTSGVQGYLEVLDSGGPTVLAAVRFTGGNAYVSTDTAGETSHAFAAGIYRQVILAFDQDAATVRFYISGADQGGRNGTWDLIGEKGYSGGTIDRVQLRTTTSGTVYADMVQVFVPGAFLMGDSIADGKPNWSEQPNYATDAGGAHGRLGPNEDEEIAPAYQLGQLLGEHVAARAFGAATSTQILNGVGTGEGLQGLVLDQHGQALYLQVGHNDLYGADGLANLQANIETIFDTAVAGGIAPDAITFCKIAPSDLFEGTPAGDEDNRIEYNRWLADFCAQQGCRLAFNCEALNDNTKTSAYKRLNPAYDVGDGTHMNKTGSAVLAREMLRARVPGGVLRRADAGLAPASYLTDAPAAATLRDLAYTVRPDTRRVLAVGYAVRATPAPIGKAAAYRLPSTSSVTAKGAAYRVATTPAAAAVGLAYEVLPAAGRISRTAVYTVRRTAPGIPAPLAYAVRTPAAPVARPLAYGIDPTVHVLLARGLAFRLTAAPVRLLGLAYRMGGEPTGALHTVAVPPEAHGATVPPETHTVEVTQ